MKAARCTQAPCGGELASQPLKKVGINVRTIWVDMGNSRTIQAEANAVKRSAPNNDKAEALTYRMRVCTPLITGSRTG